MPIWLILKTLNTPESCQHLTLPCLNLQTTPSTSDANQCLAIGSLHSINVSFWSICFIDSPKQEISFLFNIITFILLPFLFLFVYEFKVIKSSDADSSSSLYIFWLLFPYWIIKFIVQKKFLLFVFKQRLQWLHLSLLSFCSWQSGDLNLFTNH